MKRTVTVLVVAAFMLSASLQAWAQPKGTLKVGMEAETYSMDPLAAWMGYGMVMMRQIYDTPIDFGPNGELNPRLATSWQQLDDLTWRFHLRKGVKFHNGYPLTAEDVKFSIERILDPANKCRHRGRYLTFEKVNVIDDYTFDIKTKTPDALVPNRMAFFTRVVPKKWVEENGIDGLRKHAMGTGPFKFVSWKRKDRLILEANLHDRAGLSDADPAVAVQVHRRPGGLAGAQRRRRDLVAPQFLARLGVDLRDAAVLVRHPDEGQGR